MNEFVSSPLSAVGRCHAKPGRADVGAACLLGAFGLAERMASAPSKVGCAPIPTKGKKDECGRLQEGETPEDQGDGDGLQKGGSWGFDGLFPAGMFTWGFMVGSGPA